MRHHLVFPSHPVFFLPFFLFSDDFALGYSFKPQASVQVTKWWWSHNVGETRRADDPNSWYAKIAFQTAPVILGFSFSLKEEHCSCVLWTREQHLDILDVISSSALSSLRSSFSLVWLAQWTELNVQMSRCRFITCDCSSITSQSNMAFISASLVLKPVLIAPRRHFNPSADFWRKN